MSSRPKKCSASSGPAYQTSRPGDADSVKIDFFMKGESGDEDEPAYTAEEKQYLKKQFGSEYYLLRDYGMSIYKEEDRGAGRQMVRAFMERDSMEKGQEVTMESGGGSRGGGGGGYAMGRTQSRDSGPTQDNPGNGESYSEQLCYGYAGFRRPFVRKIYAGTHSGVGGHAGDHVSQAGSGNAGDYSGGTGNGRFGRYPKADDAGNVGNYPENHDSAGDWRTGGAVYFPKSDDDDFYS